MDNHREDIKKHACFMTKEKSLKIAVKMYKGNFKQNTEGKISSTELLKTADEIYEWLLPDLSKY